MRRGPERPAPPLTTRELANRGAPTPAPGGSGTEPRLVVSGLEAPPAAKSAQSESAGKVTSEAQRRKCMLASVVRKVEEPKKGAGEHVAITGRSASDTTAKQSSGARSAIVRGGTKRKRCAWAALVRTKAKRTARGPTRADVPRVRESQRADTTDTPGWDGKAMQELRRGYYTVTAENRLRQELPGGRPGPRGAAGPHSRWIQRSSL